MSCPTIKNQKVCYPITHDDKESFRASFEEPIPLKFTPGTGCNLGHMTLTMVDNKIIANEMRLSDELALDKLKNISDNVGEALQAFVNRACD